VKNRVSSVQVVADDSAVVSHVGAAMVSQLADRVAQPSLVAWRRSVRYTVARPMLKSSARSAME
jgi:hypothetical protein